MLGRPQQGREATLLLFDRLQRSNPAPAGHGEGSFAFLNRVRTGGTGYEQFLGGASRSTSFGALRVTFPPNRSLPPPYDHALDMKRDSARFLALCFALPATCLRPSP